MLLVAATLLGLANSQSASECVYHQGPLELNLFQLKGRYLGYSANNVQFEYSVCENGLYCEKNGVKKAVMVDGFPVGIDECTEFASLDLNVQPFFDGAIAAWIFNYSNGEACPDQNQQINRTTMIQYQCNPDVNGPHIVDVFQLDQCNIIVKIDWEGACVPPPPPNVECFFRSGFQEMNLSTIKGTTLRYTDTNNLAWQFTPCANGLQCLTSHGSTVNVMSEVADPEGQCIKYLGVWSGDVFPFYDRTIFGQDYWDFFWADGEECGAGGPLQVLNVRYYCNPTQKGAVITSARGSGPCQFRIEIDSALACVNQTDKAEPLKKMTQKLIERLTDPEEFPKKEAYPIL